MPEFLKKILLVVLTVLCTFLGQQYFYSKQNAINKLDVHTNYVEDYLSKPKFPTSNIELKVDGIDKPKLGLYELSLVNFTNKNYENLDIHITITPENLMILKSFRMLPLVRRIWSL